MKLEWLQIRVQISFGFFRVPAVVHVPKFNDRKKKGNKANRKSIKFVPSTSRTGVA